MGDDGFAVSVAFAAALASLFFLLLGAILFRHWWRRRDAAPASATRGGFVLFDVCFPEDRQPRRAVSVRPPSLERSRRRGLREHGDGEAAAAEDLEPDECEIARWKKIFGGPNRSLSTIDEASEKGGTTAATTPAFCTPPASPDRRRAEARALDMASIAAQVKA
ncbi:unnamed protein product [Urochloa humidicola]